ncbi:hypothetical protein CYLTODRAFT_418584 [Cylindrobasidium torrendii FP15055 ss-10]|uniref:C2H2-type domain-containing protein n=1 Tax=Cylindrobasidium torrendii FP15055 ss-10 TaxID=1314674 RepID=A0A0D7BND5_9AGAR|nr:hypothetical protein CYLTODRAFT_418584 [Cylindrobasidium torrendii FP15055 ss-10]
MPRVPKASPSAVASDATTVQGAICHVCGRKIGRKSDLARHMRIHADDKSELMHRCPFCSFGNMQKSNVQTHIRTHTGEKSRACPDCSFATTDPGSLTRHRKRVHNYVPKKRKARDNSVPATGKRLPLSLPPLPAGSPPPSELGGQSPKGSPVSAASTNNDAPRCVPRLIRGPVDEGPADESHS